jgi:hypothetical protein
LRQRLEKADYSPQDETEEEPIWKKYARRGKKCNREGAKNTDPSSSEWEIDEGEVFSLFQNVLSGELSYPEAKEVLENMYPGKDFKRIMKKMAKKFFKNTFNGSD